MPTLAHFEIRQGVTLGGIDVQHYVQMVAHHGVGGEVECEHGGKLQPPSVSIVVASSW